MYLGLNELPPDEAKGQIILATKNIPTSEYSHAS